tara:strand:+ start:1098 stop:1274 length:177 start_codon:yes stop_codon:yes gene_type:complete
MDVDKTPYRMRADEYDGTNSVSGGGGVDVLPGLRQDPQYSMRAPDPDRSGRKYDRPDT